MAAQCKPLSFDLTRLDKMMGKFYFREPFIIGNFSVDGDRNYVNDDSGLKYLVQYNDDEVNFDLNVGFEQTIFKHNDKREKIDMLLKYIMNNKQKIRQLQGQTKFSLNTDFVCFRGLLTTLFSTPYENRENWIVCATKYNGTIYLCQFDTESSLKRNAEMTEKDIRMCSYGYKFEQFMTSDNPKTKPNTSAVVNQNEENCLIFRTRLNSHSIISGAEVDCIDSNRPRKEASADAFVELKTSRMITHRRQDNNFRRFKLMRWWAQSYLIGIPRIICGFRDDDGFVHELRDYHTKHIPSEAIGWNENVCVNCCDQILSFIKCHVTEDDPRIVYKFESIPGREVRVSQVRDDHLASFAFLPDWYIQWMNST